MIAKHKKPGRKRQIGQLRRAKAQNSSKRPKITIFPQIAHQSNKLKLKTKEMTNMIIPDCICAIGVVLPWSGGGESSIELAICMETNKENPFIISSTQAEFLDFFGKINSNGPTRQWIRWKDWRRKRCSLERRWRMSWTNQKVKIQFPTQLVQMETKSPNQAWNDWAWWIEVIWNGQSSARLSRFIRRRNMSNATDAWKNNSRTFHPTFRISSNFSQVKLKYHPNNQYSFVDLPLVAIQCRDSAGEAKQRMSRDAVKKMATLLCGNSAWHCACISRCPNQYHVLADRKLIKYFISMPSLTKACRMVEKNKKAKLPLGRTRAQAILLIFSKSRPTWIFKRKYLGCLWSVWNDSNTNQNLVYFSISFYDGDDDRVPTRIVISYQNCSALSP